MSVENEKNEKKMTANLDLAHRTLTQDHYHVYTFGGDEGGAK